MKINGIEVDASKLMTKLDLLDYLADNGESDRALAYIRERNFDLFNNEMMWRYPISDGVHLGTFLIPVKEGIIGLPYDIVDGEDYELLVMEDAAMYNSEALDALIIDWEQFSDDLLGALRDMRKALSES